MVARVIWGPILHIFYFKLRYIHTNLNSAKIPYILTQIYGIKLPGSLKFLYSLYES